MGAPLSSSSIAVEDACCCQRSSRHRRSQSHRLVKNYIGDRLRRSLYVAELNRANFITSSISPAMEVVELQLQCSQEVVGGASSLVLANTYSSLVFFHRN